MKATTDKELDAMYGVEVSQAEWGAAVSLHEAAYDEDDLQLAALKLAKSIMAALTKGDCLTVGRNLAESRKATILRRAEFQCFGRITTREFEATV
jgi:hypothetical protein